MQKPVSSLRRTILFMVAMIVVSGQLSAYPLLCAMPGMDMESNGSMLSDYPAVTGDMTHSETIHAGESAAQASPDTMGFNICEQICGYCLSYNHSGSSSMSLSSSVGVSAHSGLYSRFTPSEPIYGPFRPPISV